MVKVRKPYLIIIDANTGHLYIVSLPSGMNVSFFLFQINTGKT